MPDIRDMSICEILYYLLLHIDDELYDRIEQIYNDICRKKVNKYEEPLEPVNPYIIYD
jgi:hypothetical protein